MEPPKSKSELRELIQKYEKMSNKTTLETEVMNDWKNELKRLNEEPPPSDDVLY